MVGFHFCREKLKLKKCSSRRGQFLLLEATVEHRARTQYRNRRRHPAIGESEHRGNPDYAEGVWAVVDVDITKFEGKAEKINITVPRRVLARIDAYVKAHGATRSGFLVEAARRVIEGRA